MALIKCKECGKDISDQAKTCPNCGYPIKGQQIGISVAKDSQTVTHYNCKISMLVNGCFEEVGNCKEGQTIYFDISQSTTFQFNIYSKKIEQLIKPGERWEIRFKPSLFSSKPYITKIDNII